MLIPLTRGHSAVIDESDFELVKSFKWYWVSSKMESGYARTSIPLGRKGMKRGVRRPRVTVTMHELLMGTKDVDHRDGDGLNNRRINLREATRQQQCQNRRALRGKSYKGVSRWKNRWRARIRNGDKFIFIGYFKEECDAALAYNFMAEELFGEFARFNEARV